MTTKIKSAEHLEEIELNKLLKYLYQNQLWVYYLFVRLGVSVALRYSDLSQITWNMVLGKSNLILKEKKSLFLEEQASLADPLLKKSGARPELR